MLKPETSRSSVRVRINKVCMNLIWRYPFYGYLLLHIDIVETKEDKAYTDMKSLYLNYDFVDTLDDYELEFVILHEILHAALKHPICMEGHDPILYSLAADIMVNTILVDSMNTGRIQIGRHVIMKSIFGNDAYEMGTEKIYQSLLQDRNSRYVKDLIREGSVDNHRMWGSDSSNGQKEYLEGLWEKHWKEAMDFESEHRKTGTRVIGMRVAEILCGRSDHVSKTAWKEVLREFLERSYETFDYTLLPPDRRFDSYDVFLPDYNCMEDKKLGNLWFCIDTSLSMDRSDVEALFIEIEKCIHDMGSLDGRLSFFDERVTDPVSFHTVQDIYKIKPTGGGGTDFEAIFRYMQEHMMQQPPVAIIVMTDGYATFPIEMMACGIPVLWALIGGEEVVPPWGKTIYL